MERKVIVNEDGLLIDADSGEVIRPLIFGFDVPVPAAPKRRA